MAKQNEPKKLSISDKSYIGKYRTVTGGEISVIMQKTRNESEVLEWANVHEFHNQVFYPTNPQELQKKIDAKLITKL